ncbi:MAG TPA: ABC transporter substrate-binding protein [Candidatus Limnocylindria bacterium]|nr:ABC transporter substrate-binding protein [Candidatus Limnocylindria bacterium]
MGFVINDAAIEKITRAVIAGIVLSIVMPFTGWAQSARPARPLRVAYLSTSSTMASVWMAKDSGAFTKEGLDVEVLSMQSTSAIPALLANEIDVVQVSAAPVLTAALRGIDVTFIAGLLNTMIWDFYARPEIKTIEQLKGKIVGTDRPGTPVAYGTMVALKKMGLTTKDVQLRPLGSSPQIVAAFYAGQIAGGVGSPPASFRIERDGFHSLISLIGEPYQNVGLVVRKSRIDELSARLVPLLRAVRSGIMRFYADKPFSMKVIGKYAYETDPDVLERSYEFFKKAGFRRELVTSEPGLQGVLDFLSESIPEAKTAKPGQFFDDRILRQVNVTK